MIILGCRAHYSAIGGVENSIRNLLKVAVQGGQAVTLVCREELKNEALDTTSAILPDGVECHSYPNEVHASLLRRLRFLFVGGEHVSAIYRSLYHHNPYATVIVRHHSHALAAHAAGFEGIRYLIPSLTVLQLSAELMGAPFWKRVLLRIRMLIDGWAQKRAFNHADLFVFSASMQREVSTYLPIKRREKKIHLVKPGIDATRFYPGKESQMAMLRAQLNLPQQQNLLLFVGRFSQGKGIEYFVQALQILPSDYIAVLVGQGERESSIRQWVDRKRLVSRVVFAGASSRVDDYYRACDVFIMPSITEGFGQTVIEAAACGLPIVAFHRATGVVTATHEMGLDNAISYATELSADALACTILKAIKLTPGDGTIQCSEYVHRCYCWKALLERLLG